ncbi:MAG: ABC transporter ATP-binding protein [Lachnospiraceae bacterium]|nr:ABC transporter ATP-binding protein [Lachnospiraceae bacterium]
MAFSDSILAQCSAKDEDSTLDGKLLWRLLALMKGGFWRYLAAIITMSVVLTGFDTLTAMLLRSIMARAEKFGQQDMFAGLLGEVLLCVGVGILLQFLYVVGFYVYTMEAKKGGASLQKLMYSKCMRLPFSYYENNHSSDFISKVIYDCERAQGIYGSRFRRILMPCLMTVFYLIPMLLLSWQVTLCLLGASVALFVINALFIGPMQRLSHKMSKTNVSVTERISIILSGMEQIRMFALKAKMVDRYVEDNDRFRKEQGKMNAMSAGLDGLNQFFELLGSLVFIALGLFFVSRDITTVENLAAIYVLYGSMSWELLQIGLYIPSMASYLANAKRVFEFLDLEEEPERYEEWDMTSQSSSQDMLSLRNITFAYEGRPTLLQDFSLDIPKGKCIALKGESGKGKSTIAKLLLGLYPVKEGKIYIEGKSMSSLSLEQLREKIGYVPQEPYLYDVSIAENIRYGRPEAGMEDIIRAAKLANAHDFILELEQGYETRAGERGGLLSGGQRQRIAIARAILKDAPILILDEATSALDNKSEALVNEALDRLMKGRTTIVIAHRQSTLEHADEIVTI